MADGRDLLELCAAGTAADAAGPPIKRLRGGGGGQARSIGSPGYDDEPGLPGTGAVLGARFFELGFWSAGGDFGRPCAGLEWVGDGRLATAGEVYVLFGEAGGGRRGGWLGCCHPRVTLVNF